MKRTGFKLLSVLTLLIVSISIALSLTSCDIKTPSSIDYASNYLKDYSIPDFDRAKFRTTERIFRDYSPLELPDAKTLAESTAALYFENFHEKIDTGDKEAVTNALLSCYVYATGDRYSVYRDPSEYDNYSTDMSGSFYGIGVTVIHDKIAETITVSEVYSGSGAEEAGILPGDLIVGADGERLADIGYNAVVEKLRDSKTSSVSVIIIRDGKELTLTVPKKELVEESVKYSIDEDKIGYIELSSFKSNTFSQFKEAIDYMKENGAVGIVYDLRSNPGGYLSSVVDILSYISPKGTTIASFSNDYADTMVDDDSHSLTLPSVVICNERTASAGELFTAAMRDFDEEFGYFDVTIVGTTTYGKGVMQSSFHLGDGSFLTLTVAYYNPPSGKNYDGEGITPDVPVAEDVDPIISAYEEIFKLVK